MEMMAEELLLLDSAASSSRHPAGDAAAFVLSLLPHPDTAAADADAFVDATTGTGTGNIKSLSFFALRRAALSLASALRLGLGLRRGDAVLVLSHNSLLLPQILLGVLVAGGVVASADPDATPAEIAAAAHASGAVMIVAEPEVAGKIAAVGVGLGLPPLLLTSRSLDPRTLSTEELIDGGDPTALPLLADPAAAAAATTEAEVGVAGPPPAGSGASSDAVAFLAYAPASTTAIAMTHADLVSAVARVVAALTDDDGGSRVCLASLPMCSAHGLPLLALGLPAAGVTTVLMHAKYDPGAAREAVAAHGATDFVATPEAAAAALAGAAPVVMPLDGKLSSLRRVILAPTPLTPEARQEFRRRLPWVELTQLSGMPDNETELPLPPEVIATATGAAVIQQKSLLGDQTSATNEAASLVPPPKKMNKIILGDIFSRSTMSKILRKHPVAGNRQANSKL